MRTLTRVKQSPCIGLLLFLVLAVTACGTPVNPDPADTSPAVVAMTAFVPTTDPSHNEEIGFTTDCCDATRNVPRNSQDLWIGLSRGVSVTS
jgi:hypothetical protein